MTRYHLDELNVPRETPLERAWMAWLAAHDVSPDDVPYPNDVVVDEAAGRFSVQVMVIDPDSGMVRYDPTVQGPARRTVRGALVAPVPDEALAATAYVVLYGDGPRSVAEGPYDRHEADQRWQVLDAEGRAPLLLELQPPHVRGAS